MLNKIFRLKSKFPKINIIDETNCNFKKEVQLIVDNLILNNFFDKINNHDVNIIIAENYCESVYFHSPEFQKKHFRIYGTPIGNGHYFEPTNSLSKTHTIILNTSIFSNFQFYSTIIHELTHFVDFYHYINFYGNPNLMTEFTKEQSFYYEFYLWTEFNAKKKGQKKLIHELNKLDKIINLEVTANNFKKEISNEMAKIRKLYILVHFYARISAENNELIKNYENLYPKSFIKNTFGNQWFELHSLMDEIKNFDDFLNKKELIKRLCHF